MFKVFTRNELPFSLLSVDTENRRVKLEDESGDQMEVDASVVPFLYLPKVRRLLSVNSDSRITAALLDNMVPIMAHGIFDYIDDEITSLEQCIEPTNLILMHYIGALIPQHGAVLFEGNIISKDGSESVKTRLCAWKAGTQILALVALLEPSVLPKYPQCDSDDFAFEKQIKVMGGRAAKEIGNFTLSSVKRVRGYQHFINGVFVGVSQ